MKVCKKCIMPDTRPRLTFDEDGVCAACQWAEEKKTQIDWKKREEQLIELCDSIRGKHKYDCLVPVSGGKDSTYVAHKMKHVYNLNILTLTVSVPLETDLIQENLRSFLSYGYDNMRITPNPAIAKFINKLGFIEQGRPMLSWTTCLNTVALQVATTMDIPLIMFGEEGESEYGGSTKLRYDPYYDVEDAIDLYTYGNDPAQYSKYFPKSELVWWTYPSKETIQKHPVKISHWSYFENWDSYKNYIFARDNYNMKTSDQRNSGTYTNFGQLDTPFYDLHTYMMYLKFGFGRCLQDACIDIRLGRLTRDEAIEMVRKYDNEFDENNIPLYCGYFEMSRAKYDAVLDRHANKELFEKKNGVWQPKFTFE
jgi:N-acetyl sugar amidotransferase